MVNKVLGIIFLSLMVGLPLVMWPGVNPEPAKVLLTEVLVTIWIVVEILKGQKWDWRGKGLLIGLSGLMAVSWVVNGGDLAAWGNAYRLQGGFFLLLLVVWAMGMGSWEATKIDPRVALVGLGVIVAGAVWFADNASGRAIGLAGEPTILVTGGLVLWPLVAQAGRRSLTIAAVVLLGGLIVLAGAKAGLIAGVMVGGWYWLEQSHLKMKKWGKGLSVVGLILVSLMPLVQSNRVWENRMEIWNTAKEAGLMRPILGWGWGNLQAGLDAGANKLQNNLRWEWVDDPHNIVLAWWIQGGVVGVGLLILLLFKVSRGLGKSEGVEKYIWAQLLIILWVHPPSAYALVVFWWLVGRGLWLGARSDKVKT